MKRTFKTILTLCCLALVIAACSKDDDPAPGGNNVLTLSLKNITIEEFPNEELNPSSRAAEVDANGCVGPVKKQFVAGDVLLIEYDIYNKEKKLETHKLYAKCDGADQWSFYADAACTTAAKAEFDPENISDTFMITYTPEDDAKAGIYRDWLFGENPEGSKPVIEPNGTIAPEITLKHQRVLLSVASAKKDDETDLDITALSVGIGDPDYTEPEHTLTFVKTEAGWQAITLHYTNSSYNYTHSFSLTLADGTVHTINNVNKELIKGYHYTLHLVLENGKLDIKIEEATEIPAWIDGGSTVYGDYDRIIATYADLVALRDEINNATTLDGTKLNVIQVADITMPADAEAWTEGIGNTSRFDENNGSFRLFAGVYNGNGYTINGLRVKTSDTPAGLFGYVANATLVKIHLREVNIEGTSRFFYCGSLAAEVSNSTISQCTATGVVSTTAMAGGLVGMSHDNTHYTRNYSACTVNGGFLSGGLIADSRNDLIVSCVATGDVTVNADSPVWAGGLVGSLDGTGMICYSYATGRVVTTVEAIGPPDAYAGGLVGRHSKGSIISCYSTGEATATTNKGSFAAGTFVGDNELLAGEYRDCWAPKPATGGQVIGNITSTSIPGIDADDTRKPGDVVRGNSTGQVRTLISDNFVDGNGPTGARIFERIFYGTDVWTAGDYPKIVFDPF